MTETERRQDLALTLIHQAGQLALDYFDRLATLEVETKRDGQDVVSDADRAVEDLIRATLARAFGDDGLLGEERGHEPGRNGWLWVIDPIDGTSSFLAGLRDWCISIAAMKDGVTELGLILQPTTGDLYSAIRGGGATLNGQPIHVADRAGITSHALGFGANSRVAKEVISAFVDALLAAGGMFYRNGSGALMLAYVAAGRLCGYYEAHINAWDCMAGLLLIREAGGWTADFPPDGRPLEEGGAVLAGPASIREDLSALVHQSATG
ncbi:MAG: inositol monophosphatase [Rhodobacteraceae bacterium]|nr:inositol monophosphatase [Paracoccaceae bacterium]